MHKAIVGLTVLALVGAGAVALYRHAKAKDDEGFKTVAVTRGAVVEKALAVGSIRPKREVSVKSKISGLVKRSFHEVGDRVKAGEALFEILPDPTPIELTEARRELEIARNAYEQARKTSDRSEALRSQGIMSSQDADQADKEIQDAQIRLRLASERLALVEKGRVKSEGLNVESIIRAPIDGTVLELLVNEGDPVVPLTSYQAGTTMTTLANMSTLVFKGTVDEIDVGKLKEGLPAHIKVGALPDAKVDGRLWLIAPKSKTQEGATLFEVEIELIPGTSVVLRAGFSANAEIVVREQRDVLVLPERLVTYKEGKASVELPGTGKNAEPVRKDVKTGLSDGLNVEIAEGLKDGDLVVERPPKRIE